MPTKEQIEELIAYTYNAWVENYNGTTVSGRKFTNKNDASKFIFLPAAGDRYFASSYDVGSKGYYWSSSQEESGTSSAYDMNFSAGYVSQDYNSRVFGRTVRPVKK